MKCPHDNTDLQLAGSKLTSDQRQILSVYMCPRCLYRQTERRDNPRFQPIIREPEPTRTYNPKVR